MSVNTGCLASFRIQQPACSCSSTVDFSLWQSINTTVHHIAKCQVASNDTCQNQPITWPQRKQYRKHATTQVRRLWQGSHSICKQNKRTFRLLKVTFISFTGHQSNNGLWQQTVHQHASAAKMDFQKMLSVTLIFKPIDTWMDRMLPAVC